MTPIPKPISNALDIEKWQSQMIIKPRLESIPENEEVCLPKEKAVERSLNNGSEMTQVQLSYSELMGALRAYELNSVDTLPPEEEPVETIQADQDIERQNAEKPQRIQRRNACLSKLCCLPVLRCLSSTIKSLRTCCSRAKTQEPKSATKDLSLKEVQQDR